LINTNTTVGTIRRRGISGEYKVYSYHTVSKLESDFYCLYGLNVQVFRNENNAWVKTSTTDHFTLQQQMEMCKHAKESISPMVKEQLDEYDDL
jgi:hypothetical protein